MTALEFPAPQHMRALAAANRVRLARAESKRAIADGETTVAEIIADPPEHMASMAIGDLLMCQHRWGRSRVRRLLRHVCIAEGKGLDTLTARQRSAVLEALSCATTVRFEVWQGPTGPLHIVPSDANFTACGLGLTYSWDQRTTRAWNDENEERCTVCAHARAVRDA